MCIRDSHKAAAHYDSAPAGKRNVVILQDFKAGLRGAGSIAEIGISAVSYTHLDVYKRQEEMRYYKKIDNQQENWTR